MTKLKMHTPNFTDENIKQLATLFPHCVCETQQTDDNGKPLFDKDGKPIITLGVDFELLKQELSHHIIDGSQERYRLDWVGKRASILTANSPITKTLRPSRDESVNFDNTANLFIEGDNLDALKLLQKSYQGAVKMIYIDPPYNTGNDFIYNDDFSEDTDRFLERSGQTDEDGNRLVANTESNGRFHSDWLSMMYSRLKIAKNLLSDDGVIFISIDDNEVHNLRKICVEIFGAGNFVANAIWNSVNSVLKQAKLIRKEHEYLLCYAKNKELAIFNKLENTMEFSNPDNDPNGAWFSSNAASPNQKSKKNFFAIDLPNGERCERNWKFSQDEFFNGDVQLFFKGGNVPRLKVYEKDYDKNSSIQGSIFKDLGSLTSAKLEIRRIFENDYFDTPKPLELLNLLLKIVLKKDDIALDFFAGSSTTAHAVMQLNAEDGGNRKFIMVQLDEMLDTANANSEKQRQ